MPLSSLQGTFTFESFLEHLKVHHRETNEEIRVLAYIADLAPSELVDSLKRFGFEVASLGEIIEVRRIRHPEDELEEKNSPPNEEISDRESKDKLSRTSTYYCHYNYKKNLLLCFTSDTLEDASNTIDRFVHQRAKISPLWIDPVTFDKIRRQLIRKNPDTLITEFHVRRFRLNHEEVIRDNFERYFKYMGDDGRYTLDEISRAYGVLPTSVLFVIPNVSKFRITILGKFTFVHGNLDFLFDIINEILSDVLRKKALIDKAKIEFIPVDMGRKEIKLPRVTPLHIVFSRKVDFSEMEDLVDNMKGEDFDFDIFDMLLIPGSIHLSGTVVDRDKKVAFSITGNSNRITLSPRKDTNFDSLLQFFKLIVERLDIKAQIRVANNQLR